ncbi:MAG: hypothetical protein E6Q68_02630 [Polynucleobacter sp.]|nr:MAG: hypothetical protein E6Q68_02630 [Polynucleobacter sp.]
MENTAAFLFAIVLIQIVLLGTLATILAMAFVCVCHAMAIVLSPAAVSHGVFVMKKPISVR